jgi:hypothetical protein
MLGAGIFGTLLLCAAVPAAALVTIQDYTVFSGCGGSSPCPACLAFTTDNAKSDCPILFDGHYGFKGFNQGAAEVVFNTVGLKASIPWPGNEPSFFQWLIIERF